MNYIFEAVLVGIYTCVVYLFFSLFIKNFYLMLLVVGFFKHFLGSIIGIHTWYCNNGEACLKTLSQGKLYSASTENLLRDSIIEGIVFLILGLIFRPIIGNIYLFFVIGILLHILAEKFSIHKQFCINSCYKEDSN
jgi:hypothetical protein